MKLLIATGLYPPDIGGPATYTKFLENHLPQYGIDLVVVSFSAVRKYPKGIRHMLYLWMLLKKGRSVDLIYALDTISVGVPACIASMILRRKFLVRVPGDYAWEQGRQRFGMTQTLDEYLDTPTKPFLVRVLAWLQSRVARYAIRVIVPSDYMKDVVMRWGVLPEKITRIYSAFHPLEQTKSKEVLRAQFGYSGFVITTAGRLVPWKGMDALIRAVNILHKGGTNVVLEIIGDGSERERLEACIHELQASSYVQLRGSLPKQELSARIKASDAFVLNTAYEGFSHQLLEVMDISTPIITTAVGGNRELISHGAEGLIVRYNEISEIVSALLQLSTDRTLASRVVENAKVHVQQFREETIISEIVACLKFANK